MKIALAYAMPGEIKSMLKAADAPCMESPCGVSVYQLEEDVLAYGCGVGKVNAAMSTQLVIDRHHPDLILNVGVAGCFEDLPTGTIVLASEFVQHDVDTTAVGDPIGMVSTVNRLVFPASGVETARQILREQGIEHRVGRVATGEVFLTRGARADWIADTFHPLLCEMEGGAIAQVCLRNGIHVMSLKMVSDRLLADAKDGEYFDYPLAIKNLNAVALPFAQRLKKEQL